MKIPLLCLLSLLPFPVQAGTHTWSGNGINDLFSNSGNWSAGGVPAAGETSPVILHFPANSGSPTPLDDIQSLSVDSITFDGGGYNLRGSNSATLTFKRQSTGSFAILCTNSGALSNKIESTLPLVIGSTTFVKTDNVINLDSTISGGGGLSTQGGVWLRGTSANTYAFTTTVTSGTLHLAKTNGLNCFAGDLVADGGTVRNEADNQIPDTSAITLKNGGLLVTNGHLESVGPLDFDNGTLQGTPGSSVSLLGDLTVSALGGSITGSLNLGGAIRTFTVAAAGDFHLDAAVADGSGGTGGITIGGLGYLHLGGANTFTGPVAVSSGTCVVENDLALGAGSGTTAVSGGAVLSFFGNGALNISNETLYLAGSCFVTSAATWSGPIILNSLTCSFGGTTDAFGPVNFTHTGVMSGNGKLVKTGSSRLILSGNSTNTYIGGTQLISGEIELSKTAAIAIPGNLQIDSGKVTLGGHNQIADSSAVTMNGGLLDLSAYTDTIGSLAGPAGEVQISFGTLTTGGGGGSTFSGLLSGVGGNCLVKTGSSTFTLNNSTNGGNTLTGIILVNQGSLFVDGIEAGPVTVNIAGYLSGNGTIKSAVNVSGGNIGLGTLKTGNLSINGGGSDVFVSIKSGGYNHSTVTGTVDLTGSTLDLSVAYNPYVGSSYTLIDNDGADPIVGAFAGMPEGAVFTINSQTFALSYQGGTGNDVVLSIVGGGLPLPVITSFIISPVMNSSPSQFSIMIDGSGQPNTAHRLQSSIDLIQWQDIPGSLTSDAQGHFSSSFVDLSVSKRFYRLAVP